MKQNELKKSLYKGLKELGLSEAEINLYSVSLELGQTSIVNIARHMGISRPNVYKVIAGLETHGLAKFSDKGKYARAFLVESPTVVLEMIRKKREAMTEIDHNLVSALPELVTKYHQGQAPTKVKVLEGKEQFLKIFKQSLEEEKKEILFFGATEDFISYISWTEERKWITHRVKKNIFVKVLTLPGKGGAEILRPQDKEELRETRILKGAWPFLTSFQLFGNKVVIWQPKTPLAVLIEDQYIVEMMKSTFDWIWERSSAKID
ncbi:MAG TPA: helix-turn-helix domain-containing protein [Candidatus Bathyarchaeia archaeon]|nr:helix-turn-helix domain-containing protein [Candidatus Bathyarchaeia archaeon]